MDIIALLGKFERVKKNGRGFSARCPSHEDKKNSLSLTEADGGKVLIRCFAGCTAESVMAAVGLRLSDLFAEKKSAPKDPVTASYVYTDESGKPLFRVCRTASKGFYQQRFEGGKFVSGLGGVRRVVFNLPQVLKAKSVVVVEGEKDVETVRKIGIVATTNPGGAGKWNQSYNEFFKGKYVSVIGDNDEPGKKHAADVARSLSGVAEEVKLIELPGLLDKGDVTDYLRHHSKDMLVELIGSTERVKTEEEMVTLDVVEPEEVEWLWTDRIPIGCLTGVQGDPEVGKSQLCYKIAALVSRGEPLPGNQKTLTPSPVLLFEFEDPIASVVRKRLERMGADLRKISVVNPKLPSGVDFDLVKRWVKRTGPLLVIINPITDYGGERNNNRDSDVVKLLRPLAALSQEWAFACLIARHLNKQAGPSALYRGSGSIQYAGQFRSVFTLGLDRKEPARRILAHTKNNFGLKQRSLTFTLDEYGLHFTGEVDMTADELVAPATTRERESAKLDRAKAFLEKILEAGPVRESEIKDKTKGIHTDATLWRAKNELGVQSQKEKGEMGGKWWWRLPGGEEWPWEREEPRLLS
jgi:putative DNA primase/helicase